MNKSKISTNVKCDRQVDYYQQVINQTRIKYNYILKLTNTYNSPNSDQRNEPIENGSYNI